MFGREEVVGLMLALWASALTIALVFGHKSRDAFTDLRLGRGQPQVEIAETAD